MCFAQFAEIYVVGDTTDLKNYGGSGVVLLDQYSGDDVTGGGLFHRIDSTYTEGSYAFDYTTEDGYQWARILVIDPDPNVQSLTASGAISGQSLSLDSAVTIGQDAFTTTATKDTVIISGAESTDVYVIQPISETLDAQDIQFQVNAKSDTLVVTRPSSGASGLGYYWIRFKVH